jgi:hypothetical protein
MTLSQADFRAALLHAGLPVPEGLLDAHDAPAGTRFSVYRNNVVVSLSEALRVAFPLVRKLLGNDTFDRLAGIFLRRHPPETPLMMHYGSAMPGFLRNFEPLQHIGYLADCAALDLALRKSYHAADAAPLEPARLTDPESASAAAFALAPSSLILRSAWPLYDIWRFNTEQDAPKPRAIAQDMLISRPAFDPKPHLLPPGAADWLDFLDRGMGLEAAAERVTETTPDFDLERTLTLVLQAQALTEKARKDS